MEADVTILSSLYSVSGIIITLLYIPQLLAIYKSDSPMREISIPTWGVWTVCLSISSVYAYYIAKDIKIFLVYLAGSFFCGAITLCVVHKRRKYRIKAGQ